MNATARLLRLLLSRGDYLERFERDQLKKLLPILESAHESVLGKLAATQGEWTREWLSQMSTDIDAIYAQAMSKLNGELTPELQSLLDDEIAYAQEHLGHVVAGVSITTPSSATLWASIAAMPAASGSTLDSLMEALSLNTRRAVIEAIQAGMASGDTLDQMVRRLRGTTIRRASWRKGPDGRRVYVPGVYEGGAMEDVSTRQAKAFARTAIMHVSNAAREALYNENQDIIKGYQHIATLDGDTCLACGAMDGREYGLDDPRPALPLHPSCRCLYLPVLKSWRELGIDADELPPGSRASMDGLVPEYETYADRIAKANRARRIELLGPARASMYERGIKLRDMVSPDGKPYTLKELMAKRQGAA